MGAEQRMKGTNVMLGPMVSKWLTLPPIERQRERERERENDLLTVPADIARVPTGGRFLSLCLSLSLSLCLCLSSTLLPLLVCPQFPCQMAFSPFRNYESMGEDPTLAATMATQVILGVQSQVR